MARTSKYRIAEQAQRIVLGGSQNADAEVTVQEMMIYVSQAVASVVRRRYFEGRNEGEVNINGDWIYSFDNEPVLEDTGRGEKYVDLPATSVSLPYDMGVFHISPMKDQGNAYVPIPNGFNNLLRGLDAGRLEGRVGYYVEGGRVYLKNLNNNNTPKQVLVKLIVPIGGLGDEEDIVVSDDIQEEVVRMAVQLYKIEQETPQDEINDSVK